jgi:hypothetical protein
MFDDAPVPVSRNLNLSQRMIIMSLFFRHFDFEIGKTITHRAPPWSAARRLSGGWDDASGGVS